MIKNNKHWSTNYWEWTESVMKYQPHSKIERTPNSDYLFDKIAVVNGREVGRFEPHNKSGYVELRVDMVKLGHFIDLFTILLKENMSYRVDGYRRDADLNIIVENLRTTLIEYKRINVTTTLRKTCLNLDIIPNGRAIRQYLRLKQARLGDKRRFAAFGGEHPISAFSEFVGDKLDTLSVGEKIKIGRNSYRRVK